MNRRRSLTLALGLFLALASSAVAQARDGAATRWGVAGSAPVDFHVAVDSAVAHSGRASMRIVAEHEPGGFATLITTLPAALRVALAAAAADSTSEQFTATLERLVAALKDGHGSTHRTGTTRAMPDVRLAASSSTCAATRAR